MKIYLCAHTHKHKYTCAILHFKLQFSFDIHTSMYSYNIFISISPAFAMSAGRSEAICAANISLYLIRANNFGINCSYASVTYCRNLTSIYCANVCVCVCVGFCILHYVNTAKLRLCWHLYVIINHKLLVEACFPSCCFFLFLLFGLLKIVCHALMNNYMNTYTYLQFAAR